jgi:hypothetical protein
MIYTFLASFLKNNWKVVLIVLLSGVCLAIAFRLFSVSEDRDRQKGNLYSALDKVKYVENLNGTISAQSETMNLRIAELKQLYPELLKEVKNMRIKQSQIEQVGQTVIRNETNVQTLIRDSVIYTVKDTIPVKTFSYADNWYNVNGVCMEDSINLNIIYTDTLTQVIYRGERINPKLWIFSRRKIQQRASFTNPNNKIVFQKFISIQKRNKQL